VNPLTDILTPSSDPGRLGILHLRRYWHKTRLIRDGKVPAGQYLAEWNLDTALLNSLGLGLEQTLVHLYNHCPDVASFEDWVERTTDLPLMTSRILRYNDYVQANMGEPAIRPPATPLSPEEWAAWEEQGYTIIREAISREDAAATAAVICNHIGVDPDSPETWYRPHPDRQGIMVQLFQHPLLEKNRHSPRIRAVYEQLWNRSDIWVNTDRAGFNPPETEHWSFPGPRLHWDVSLKQPIPLGLQGILYLTDTEADQGAFTLVPGFHKRVGSWLASLPPGAHPREQDIYALGPTPIAACAGDFIIWHHALPHGSSPNRSPRPRYVQYINYAPLDAPFQEEWI
jgi:hypothetical protein